MDCLLGYDTAEGSQVSRGDRVENKRECQPSQDMEEDWFRLVPVAARNIKQNKSELENY